MGSACVAFSLVMLFEVVRMNDILFYCQQNNLMLIDELCTEEVVSYGKGLFFGGMLLGGAGILFVVSVLVAPNLPDFNSRGGGLKV